MLAKHPIRCVNTSINTREISNFHLSSTIKFFYFSIVQSTILIIYFLFFNACVASAHDINKDTSDAHTTVANMLHARTDFSWLFDPVTLQHMEPSPSETADATRVAALAKVAKTRGFANRADVRAAQAAAGELILAEAARRSLVDSLRPTDAEVAQHIVENPGRYDEYRLRHIFVAIGRTRDGKTRNEAEALALAKRIRARILGGERFETVAAAESEDASTAVEGGALSGLLGTTMNPAFLPYVKDLPQGGISEPVRGPEGFHIIKLDDRQPATVNSARYWVEEEIIKERLPKLISDAIAAEAASADR